MPATNKFADEILPGDAVLTIADTSEWETPNTVTRVADVGTMVRIEFGAFYVVVPWDTECTVARQIITARDAAERAYDIARPETCPGCHCTRPEIEPGVYAECETVGCPAR